MIAVVVIIIFIVFISVLVWSASENVRESKPLINVHQQLAEDIAITVASICGQHRFRDALVQVLTDFVDWKERDRRLEGPWREQHFRFMNSRLRSRSRWKSLREGIGTNQLPQQCCLSGAGGPEKQCPPIL